jgi:hypothetical protein
MSSAFNRQHIVRSRKHVDRIYGLPFAESGGMVEGQNEITDADITMVPPTTVSQNLRFLIDTEHFVPFSYGA